MRLYILILPTFRMSPLCTPAHSLIPQNRTHRCNLLTMFPSPDIRLIDSEAVRAVNSGMIILGGGLIKHHVCNANLMVSTSTSCHVTSPCGQPGHVTSTSCHVTSPCGQPGHVTSTSCHVTSPCDQPGHVTSTSCHVTSPCGQPGHVTSTSCHVTSPCGQPGHVTSTSCHVTPLVASLVICRSCV